LAGGQLTDVPKSDGPSRYFIKTYGCQMNEYDSSRIGDVLASSLHMQATDNPAEADVLLVNTC
jgi:tRNA-2-methylthio-N6-dimethylallyladenosine synthase